jgi:hypothetical protein
VGSPLVDALSSGEGVPGDERARPQEPLVAGAKQMPSDGEEVPNDAVDREDRWACATDLKRRMCASRRRVG